MKSISVYQAGCVNPPPHDIVTSGLPKHVTRLRDAAPDLLEALKLLHDNLAEYQRINNIGGYDNHDMKMARAAIAKATSPD